MNSFKIAWQSWHPFSSPVGYMMRWTDEPYWLRIHSLPLSKRYAETPVEREFLISLQNELAAEVLGLGQSCWLAQSCWVTPGGFHEITDEQIMFAACRDFQLTWAYRFIVDEEDGLEHAWNVYAAMTTWERGKFDQLLWAVANEKAAPVVWMSNETGVVFAPYDGGVDLFLTDQAQLKRLSAQFADWLPSSTEGL
jgi:hypothetical protein